MAYLTPDALKTRLGNDELIALADLNRDGTPDTDVVQRALDDASAEIDVYLGQRYAVPLSTTPAIVTRLCADIARYRLYDDRPLDEVKARYEAANQLLRDIAAGKASIGLPDPQKEDRPTPAPLASTKAARDRTFTLDSLSDF